LRIVLPILCIVALAFGYRLVVMADRAAAPNEESFWDPLPAGNDQSAYINQLRGIKTGDFPPNNFYFQPGIVYLLGVIAALAGTTDLLDLRLIQAAMASLNCGLMAVTAWQATGRLRAGYIAGLLLALYPISVCYDTDFIITSQAVIIATMMLAFTLLAERKPGNLAAPLCLGLLTGFGAITRFELIAPGLVCAIWLLLRRRRKRQLLLALAGIAIVVAPIARHNWVGGSPNLISSEGTRFFYRGNNRDSSGVYGPSNAASTTNVDFLDYLLHDIALEPVRFAQLWLYKTALFLSDHEHGNNLDFRRSCQSLSPLLFANRFSFPHLAVLGGWGLLALWLAGRREVALLMLSAGAAYGLLVIATMVESRLKTPVVPWLIPAAAFAVDRALILARGGLTRSRLKRGVLLVGISALIYQFVMWGKAELPRDVTVSELPGSASHAGLRYDDTLELAGWLVREQYSARHAMEPNHPWVVSLYWRLLKPTDIDYSFSLKYRIDQETLLEYDRPIGYTVFPRKFTSQWQAGDIYVEHIGLMWRGFRGPFERTGRVTVEVYPEREAHQRSTPHDVAGAPTRHPVLAQPAIMQAPGRNRVEADREIPFGERFVLRGYELPATAAGGETVPVRMAWRAGDKTIEADFAIGVYAFLDGKFVANEDSPPHGGAFRTFSILPGYRFDDEKLLTLPAQPGNYEIFVGVYDLDTMERLPVSGRDDNLYRIGTIRAD
jgi:hypothetical protein